MTTQIRPEQANLTKYWAFGSGTLQLPCGTDFPTGPADGDIFYRTDEDLLYMYDGAGWELNPSAAHSILSALHDDTTPAEVGRGNLMIGVGAAPNTKWTALTDVAVGAYFRSGGVLTEPLWSTLLLPNAATAFRLPVATSANTIGELAAVGADGEFLEGNTGAIPSWNKIIASDVTLPDGIGTPSYDDLDDWFTNTRSAGRITGGVLTPNAAVNGKVDISELEGMIFTADSLGSPLVYFKKAAVANVEPADGAVSWIYYDYTTDGYLTTTTHGDINEYDQFCMGRVWRLGNDVEVQSTGDNLWNEERRVHNRLILKYSNMDRISGAVISKHATALRLAVDAGSWYSANTPFTTELANTFYVWYKDGGPAWIKSAEMTLFSDIFNGDAATTYETYQNGNDLAALTANKYGVYWAFICPEGDLYLVLDIAAYANVGDAQASTVPAALPPYLVDWGRLIGRVICKNAAAALYSVESIFAYPFTLSAATWHPDLGGRSEVDAHPQASITGLTTADSPVFVTAKLSDLTDDYIPYHVDDATGLANGPTKTDVDSAVALKHAAAHVILSASHTDTLADAIVDGDVLIGNVTPLLSRLPIDIPGAGTLHYLGVNNTELRPSYKAASSSPGEAAAILATDASGHLILDQITLTNSFIWKAGAEAQGYLSIYSDATDIGSIFLVGPIAAKKSTATLRAYSPTTYDAETTLSTQSGATDSFILTLVDNDTTTANRRLSLYRAGFAEVWGVEGTGDMSLAGDITMAAGKKLYIDHIGEATGAHNVVFDNTVALPASTLVPDGGIIRCAGAPVVTFDDTNDMLELSGAHLTVANGYALLQSVPFSNNGDEGTLVQGRTGAVALTAMSSIAEDVVVGRAGLVWYTYDGPSGGFVKRMALTAPGVLQVNHIGEYTGAHGVVFDNDITVTAGEAIKLGLGSETYDLNTTPSVFPLGTSEMWWNGTAQGQPGSYGDVLTHRYYTYGANTAFQWWFPYSSGGTHYPDYRPYFRMGNQSGATWGDWMGMVTQSTTGDVVVPGAFGCNGNAAQGKYASGGLLAGVVAALVANGILSN